MMKRKNKTNKTLFSLSSLREVEGRRAMGVDIFKNRLLYECVLIFIADLQPVTVLTWVPTDEI
jgi:hypothetical protein